MIRKMKIEDKAEILAMMKVFYASDAVINKASDEILIRDIEDCCGDCPFIEGFTFEKDGQIAGYGMASISYTTEYGGINIWVEDLYVKPEYRRMGFATEFFAYIEEYYKNIGAVRYKLEVENYNENAIKTYRSVGYSELKYDLMDKLV